MSLSPGNQLLTESSVIVARSKLPDDLLYGEYVDLVEALQTLANEARNQSSVVKKRVDGRVIEERISAPTVLRVQYGSDFVVVLAFVASAAVSVTVIAGAFIAISKGLKILAEAGVANEQRLALKDERVKRRTELKRAEAVLTRGKVPLVSKRGIRTARTNQAQSQKSIDIKNKMRAVILAPRLRNAIDNLLGGPQSDEFYFGLVTLAEYGVRITVED